MDRARETGQLVTRPSRAQAAPRFSFSPGSFEYRGHLATSLRATLDPRAEVMEDGPPWMKQLALSTFSRSLALGRRAGHGTGLLACPRSQGEG